MIHAHDRYKHIQDQKNLIGKDEPVFLIRATDPIAIHMMNEWLKEAQYVEKHKSKIQGVERHLALMLKWKRKNQKE